MANDATNGAADEAQNERRSMEATARPFVTGDVSKAPEGSSNDSIAIVDSRIFLAECMRQCMQATFGSFQILTFSDIGECQATLGKASPKLVLVSVADSGRDVANTLQLVSQSLPNVPIVVLAGRNDADLARAAIRHGAKGFIPVTTRFRIVLEAVRFVLSGGTYVPTECLFATNGSAAQANPSQNALTTRELSVVRAIQQGKPNKIIAYELNMCESTVKVHLRNIMKKLGAKNRTEVAIKAQIDYLPERKATSTLTIAA